MLIELRLNSAFFTENSLHGQIAWNSIDFNGTEKIGSDLENFSCFPMMS